MIRAIAVQTNLIVPISFRVVFFLSPISRLIQKAMRTWTHTKNLQNVKYVWFLYYRHGIFFLQLYLQITCKFYQFEWSGPSLRRKKCTQNTGFDMMWCDAMWNLNCESIDWQHFSWKVVHSGISAGYCNEFHLDFFSDYRGALQSIQRNQVRAVRCVGWFTPNTIGFRHFENTICISVDKTHHGNQIPRCKCALNFCNKWLFCFAFVSKKINWWLFVCIPGNW